MATGGKGEGEPDKGLSLPRERMCWALSDLRGEPEEGHKQRLAGLDQMTVHGEAGLPRPWEWQVQR